MEQWQLVGLITRRSLVRIQLPLPVRARGVILLALSLWYDSVCCSHLPPSSRGLGRRPFKAETRGSNPLGGTAG